MNKFVLILLGCLLSTAAFADCSKTNNYAAQYKVEDLLHKDLFDFDGMTWKQLGNEHWYITKRLYPWSEKIHDECLRNEVQGYLTAELNYMYDYISDQKKPKEDRTQPEEVYQTRGRVKKESFLWPKTP